MTIQKNHSGAAPSGAVPLLCAVCGIRPATRGRRCSPCRHAGLVPEQPTLVCAAEGCEQTFVRDKSHWTQIFCSKKCNDATRMARNRAAGRHRKPTAKETRRRAEFRRRGYGITPEEFDEIVVLQDSVCSICDHRKLLVPDHCHRKGAFRGAICSACNFMLGHALDDPEILRRAADYLDQQV